MEREVVVVIGTGGMGQAVARRLGPSRSLVLADVAPALLDTVSTTLTAEGHLVTPVVIDISDADAVAGLASTASAQGPVRFVIHTAGLSPVQASAEAILKVDLLGVAFTLEEFAPAVAPGGCGVVIASMAGHLAPAIPAEEESQLALTPARELAALPALEASRHQDPGLAYAYAKRAAHLRVRAASVEWGRRGARVNSISPGVISTSMGQAELQGPTGSFMRDMVRGSGTSRLGTADDIAAAVEFLVSPAASFVTGTDLLVDGGVIGAMTTGQITFG